jgi:RNA polymerase sigma-70 factor (ECF subfamily)
MKRESELVRRASQGDQAAFGQLVEIHWSRLVRLARSVVGEAEAEDAAQDGLIQAWRKLPQLADPAAFGSWLSRVVVRICIRRARAQRSGFVSLEKFPEPRIRTNPEAAIDVARLLGSLAPRQRAVMHLTVVEGMTDSEIAPLLGITAASVRAHRHRARERLERQIPGRSAA